MSEQQFRRTGRASKDWPVMWTILQPAQILVSQWCGDRWKRWSRFQRGGKWTQLLCKSLDMVTDEGWGRAELNPEGSPKALCSKPYVLRPTFCMVFSGWQSLFAVRNFHGLPCTYLESIWKIRRKWEVQVFVWNLGGWYEHSIMKNTICRSHRNRGPGTLWHTEAHFDHTPRGTRPFREHRSGKTPSARSLPLFPTGSLWIHTQS